MFALPYKRVIQIKFISANNPYFGKDSQFRVFYVVKGEAKISLEPTGSQMLWLKIIHMPKTHSVGILRDPTEGLVVTESGTLKNNCSEIFGNLPEKISKYRERFI